MGILLHNFVIFCACYIGNGVSALEKGEVEYTVDITSAQYYTIIVTNGAFIVKTTVSIRDGDVIGCEVTSSSTDSIVVFRNKQTKIENIGIEKISQILKNCQQLPKRPSGKTNNDKTGALSGTGRKMAIYQGTKWCGYENVARSIEDLGIHDETDSCCRTHDLGQYYIDRFESKYHYYNIYPMTISHCDCDQHLYDCLKKVNTTTSYEVGTLFFGLLNVQCFTFEEGQYCKDSSSILSNLWCSKKTVGERAVMNTFDKKWSDDAENP